MTSCELSTLLRQQAQRPKQVSIYWLAFGYLLKKMLHAIVDRLGCFRELLYTFGVQHDTPRTPF